MFTGTEREREDSNTDGQNLRLPFSEYMNCYLLREVVSRDFLHLTSDEIKSTLPTVMSHFS